MQTVKANDSVTILYDGLLSNGELFESAKDTGPLRFTVGAGSVLAAFERVVLGMSPNQTQTVTVPAKEAYGLRNEELVMDVPRSNFEGKSIAPGMILGMTMESEGQEHRVPATIVALDPESVTIDFNHPMAGQDITYRITLLTIESPAPSGCGCSQTPA